MLAFLNMYFMFAYITGRNLFDKTLSPNEEKFYIEEYEKGSVEAKNILIEKNLRLVAHIVKKYESSCKDSEDLISIGTIGLIKAVSSYNSSKNVKLATYAAKCIDNEILMYLRAGKKYNSDLYLEEPIGNDNEGNEIVMMDIISGSTEDIEESIYKKQQIEILFNKLDVLDEREKEIIIMRYGLFNTDEMTQIEIAKKMGISRSYVSRIEKKALEKLKKCFEF